MSALCPAPVKDTGVVAAEFHYTQTESFVALLHELRASLLVSTYQANKLLVVRANGSGLSTLDRVTPRLLVATLRLLAQRPELRPIVAGLPVAGFTGTLTDRYRSRQNRAGAGLVRAKTGTLAGVNTLAGTVVDADGRLLVFAFLTNRATGPDATEAALDRLAAALAGCGCH